MFFLVLHYTGRVCGGTTWGRINKNTGFKGLRGFGFRGITLQTLSALSLKPLAVVEKGRRPSTRPPPHSHCDLGQGRFHCRAPAVARRRSLVPRAWKLLAKPSGCGRLRPVLPH